MPALHYQDHAEPAPASTKRPGLTSLVRTSRGLMTIQTELVGNPGEFVTIVDFRGRVLKRWTHPLTAGLDEVGQGIAAREWHAQRVARVSESLAKAARSRRRSPFGSGLSRLYLAGMSAYAKRDFEAAEVAWRACARLLPEDRRIQSALARVQE